MQVYNEFNILNRIKLSAMTRRSKVHQSRMGNRYLTYKTKEEFSLGEDSTRITIRKYGLTLISRADSMPLYLLTAVAMGIPRKKNNKSGQI